MIDGDFSVRVSKTLNFVHDENLNEIVDCINKMAEELSGVETLRTDFISNVSHEMKTPLAVINNYATLLQSSDIDCEKRIEYANSIKEAVARLSNMMTNILKLNRLENQQIYPKVERYCLGEQLCECLLQYESTWEEKNLQIETDITDDLYVCADRELLSHVWSNLFSNAVKFTPEGGKITLTLKEENDRAVVSVEDTGRGISPEVGKHIFEKFYQGDTSHASQGNGLGLALVKRIVDIVKGEISVESVPGEGTKFTVKIERGERHEV